MDTQKVIKGLERKIKFAEESLVEWQQAFLIDPLYSFRWSDRAMETAATLSVYKSALKMLTADGRTIECLRSRLTDAVMSKATCPSRSTSPAENICSQYELAAMAELLRTLED